MKQLAVEDSVPDGTRSRFIK